MIALVRDSAGRSLADTAHQATVTESGIFDWFMRDYGEPVEHLAARLALSGEISRQELIQEALITLWDADPSRFDPANYSLLVRKMQDAMRDAKRAARRDAGGARRARMSVEKAEHERDEPRCMRRADKVDGDT